MRRITASLCGKILCQKEMTLALLKAVLYPRHFECPPISIQWGKDNEHRASQEYLKHAKSWEKESVHKKVWRSYSSCYGVAWGFT